MGFHDVPLKAMFGSSCFPCVLQGVHVMLMLFVFIYAYWYPTWFPCGMIFLTLIINTKGVSDGAGLVTLLERICSSPLMLISW